MKTHEQGCEGPERQLGVRGKLSEDLKGGGGVGTVRSRELKNERRAYCSESDQSWWGQSGQTLSKHRVLRRSSKPWRGEHWVLGTGHSRGFETRKDCVKSRRDIQFKDWNELRKVTGFTTEKIINNKSISRWNSKERNQKHCKNIFNSWQWDMGITKLNRKLFHTQESQFWNEGDKSSSVSKKGTAMCGALRNPANALDGPEKPVEDTPKSCLFTLLWAPIYLSWQYRHLKTGVSGLPTQPGHEESWKCPSATPRQCSVKHQEGQTALRREMGAGSHSQQDRPKEPHNDCKSKNSVALRACLWVFLFIKSWDYKRFITGLLKVSWIRLFRWGIWKTTCLVIMQP